MSEVQNAVGETKISYALGGFPAPGATPQLDRYLLYTSQPQFIFLNDMAGGIYRCCFRSLYCVRKGLCCAHTGVWSSHLTSCCFIASF